MVITQETEKEEIEYETVTLKVPKKIMAILKSMAENYAPDPISYLEWRIVDCIRADLEAAKGDEIIDWLGLAPIFHQVLDDERFKP